MEHNTLKTPTRQKALTLTQQDNTSTFQQDNTSIRDLLAKDRVELLGDVVLLVVVVLGAQANHQVGVSLAVDVCRVKVVRLEDGERSI